MSRTKELTLKQRAFCEEYLRNGGNATQAYLAAYDGNSALAANVESSRLLEREDIQDYIKRLRRPIEKAVVRKIVNERQRKKQIIEERLMACIEREDDAAIARYLEIWNKMDGEYVNINKDITDQSAEIVNLDTATLQQLAKAE